MKPINTINQISSFNIDEFKKIFSNYLEVAYAFTVKPCESTKTISTASKFGGQPYSQGEPWPICGSCYEPLRFIFQFNNSGLDSPYTMNTNCLYVFFMCDDIYGECYRNKINKKNVTWCIRQYTYPSITKAQKIIAPSYTQPEPGCCIGRGEWLGPVEPSKITVAKIKSLKNLNLIDDIALKRLETLASNPQAIESLYEEIALKIFDCSVGCCPYDSKYLGTPYNLKPAEIPQCISCNKTMDLLFQVSSETNAQLFTFGNPGYMYLFSCQAHRDIIDFYLPNSLQGTV